MTTEEKLGAERVSPGSRRRYAENSLEWTETSGHMVGEYLQRIHSLASDVMTLEDEVVRVRGERDEARATLAAQQRRVDAIAAVIAKPTSDFEETAL